MHPQNFEQMSIVSPCSEDLETLNVNFTPSKSPDSIFIKLSTSESVDGGALRAGGALDLKSRAMFGLLCQYAAVGLVYGTLPQLILPFLTYYLNTEGIITAAAAALMDVPWAFKAFFGMLSDNVPIRGYRRRPYMIVGWVESASALFIAGSLRMPEPYFPNPAWRDIKPSDYTPEITSRLNYDAQHSGGTYVLLMTLAILGCLVADCAADGAVVEYAQREPLAVRGRTQTAVYITRTLAMAISQVIIGFGLNTPDYGGTFSFGLSVSTIMYLLAFTCIITIPITWAFIVEEKHQSMYFSLYIMELWENIQSPAFYNVVGFSFFYGIFGSVGYVAFDTMTSYWVGATSFSISLTIILGYVIFAGTLYVTGKYGLNWDWRFMIAITNIVSIGMDAVCTMLTTFDIIRRQWLWLGVKVLENVPIGIGFMIQSFVVVELAGEGCEGTIYGFITTVQNLGTPFATTIEKNINAPFSVWNDDILNDTPKARRDVAITIWISYIMKLFSLVFLLWLPRQKKEVLILKSSGKKSKFMGVITLMYTAFALLWSILANVLSMFEETKCWSITGGCNS